MFNLNRVTLIGCLGADPKTIKTNEGKASFVICQLATNETWKHENVTKTHTQWHEVEISKPFANYISKYAKKGDCLFVQGRLRTRKWENKKGEQQSKTVINASSVKLRKKTEKPIADLQD